MRSSRQKRKLIFFIFLVGIAAFTADVLDLRDELQMLPCPFGSLDNNVATGLISDFQIDPGPVVVISLIQRKASFKVSLSTLFSYSFRAPPA
ncbi:MAG: hypothetical protein LLG93_04270 [Deltaproteobacteria bacterium]|nr:hypothetical protein [Deltaproteobacteria bacterium]